MTVVLIFASIALLITIFFVVLGLAAARRADLGPDPLDELMGVRSPSGSPFFATDGATRDLIEDLEDVPDRSS